MVPRIPSSARLYVQRNRSKLIKSFLCFASYAGMGASFTMLGSCLLDYQILINESFTKVAYLVQERAFGYVCGALMAGFIENYVNKLLVLSLANLGLGLSLIISPWSASFTILSGATVLGGISLGFLEIYCNVYIAHLWKAESTNYFQALHMFFDIGALIAPLISRPFLLPMDAEDYNAQPFGSAGNSSGLQIQMFTSDDVLIQYPHLMLGFFLVLVALLFSLTVCSNDNADAEADYGNQASNKDTNQPAQWKQLTAIMITALIVNFEFGGQNLASALGPAFAVKSDLKMDKQEATVLITVYWAVCCVYRLFLIPLTSFVSESKLILFNALIIISGALTMAAGADHNLTLCWISFCLLSMGFAPCFAFSLGLVQKYFHITSRRASLIFLFGTLGESVHPWIVSAYLESYSPFYTRYFASIALLNSFLLIVLVTFTAKAFKQTRYDYEPLS